MVKTKKGMSGKAKAAIGIGAGLAAAGVAAFLLLGERGEKNRKAVKAWAGKMQGEISREIGKLKQVSKAQYLAIVSEVAKRYKNIDKADLDGVVADLKNPWKNLEKKIVKNPAAKRRK